MTDIPENAGVYLSIETYPKICSQIGNFVVGYSGMELALWKLYAKILGLDEESTINILGGIQSFTYKMAAVIRFLEQGNNPNKERCLELFANAAIVNSFRIDLLHGIYMVYPDKTLWLHSSLTDPTRKKSRAVELTKTKIIQKKTTLAHNTARAIAREFFGIVKFDHTAISSLSFPDKSK